MGIGFRDETFQYGFEVTLGAVYRQAADVGEVITTARRIIDEDTESWLREWTTTAGTVWSEARSADRQQLPVTALAHYRRAATYYDTALSGVAHTGEPGCRRDLWRRQRDCWERIVDLTPIPGERILIDYIGTALPGFFFRAPDAVAGERRPLVVINNGSDTATSQMWSFGGAAANERGYHWMTFDGPGQQAALFEQGIECRADWEQVLTPVLDAMLTRPDVDGTRVAVIGIGQAGYLVPRALAFEHRFAAAVVDPGVVDVSASWLPGLSPTMRGHLDNNDRAAFDREMHLAELFSPTLAATVRLRGEPYGSPHASRFDLYRRVQEYRLGGELDQVNTPMLITDPEREQHWPGQSPDLYERLTGPRQLLRLSIDAGSAVRETRIFDWLAQHLSPLRVDRPVSMRGDSVLTGSRRVE